MKTFAVSVCVLLISSAAQVMAANPAPDASLCGPYPTNYKEIVMKWLDTHLEDAASARIEWTTEPKPADLGTNEKHLYGWVVYFKVNARNVFGAYTGMIQHGALIYKGEVIKALGLDYR